MSTNDASTSRRHRRRLHRARPTDVPLFPSPHPRSLVPRFVLAVPLTPRTSTDAYVSTSPHDDGIFNLYRLGPSVGPSRARAIRARDSVRPSRRARLDRRRRDTRRRAGRCGTHTPARLRLSHRRIAAVAYLDRSHHVIDRCNHSMKSIDDIGCHRSDVIDRFHRSNSRSRSRFANRRVDVCVRVCGKQ